MIMVQRRRSNWRGLVRTTMSVTKVLTLYNTTRHCNDALRYRNHHSWWPWPRKQTVHYDKLRGTVELKARLDNQDDREHHFSSSILDMQLQPYHKHWVMQALVNMGSGGNFSLLGGQCRVPDPWQIELSIFRMYLQVAVRRHRWVVSSPERAAIYMLYLDHCTEFTHRIYDRPYDGALKVLGAIASHHRYIYRTQHFSLRRSCNNSETCHKRRMCSQADRISCFGLMGKSSMREAHALTPESV
jgi:hypothetical protein